jgi:hypothetical protein
MNDKTLEAIKRKNMEVSQLGKMYQMCNDNNLRFLQNLLLDSHTKLKKHGKIHYALQLI